MNRIVQLEEREYNDLFEKANFTQEQINKKALELYKKNGFAELRLNIRTEYDSMYSGLTFKASVEDDKYFKEGLFKSTLSDTKKLVEFLDQNVKEIVKRKYGIVTETSQMFEKELKHNRQVQNTFKYVTIGGWVFTFILSLILIFK